MAELIPGPRGLQIPRALRGVQSNPLDVLVRAQRRWGNYVFFPISQGGVVLVNEVEGVEHVLVKHTKRYTKDTVQFRQFQTIVGEGSIAIDGDKWRRQRKLVQPPFVRKAVLNMGELMVRTTERMLARWDEKLARGEAVIDADAEMMRVALEVVTTALFSIDVTEEASDLVLAVKRCMDHMVYKGSHILAPPDHWPTPRNRAFREGLQMLDGVVERLVRERRADPNPPLDLLQSLIAARDEETHAAMDDKQLRDEIVTLIVAGHETVATALMWGFYLLSLHPAEKRRVQATVDEVLEGRPPTVQDLPELAPVDRFIQETMRILPPVWLITRRATEEDTIAGYRVPKGAHVVISPYLLHRNTNVWDNPEGFDPDRFLPEQAKGRRRAAHIPFGFGPHRCLGDRFAELEMTLIATMVLQRYDLSLVPGSPIEQVPLATIRPRFGIPMRLRRREAARAEVGARHTIVAARTPERPGAPLQSDQRQ